ncbi:MAG: transketolase [Planctomycetes bacterium]|nr:transketolase [Planctomycetota bacterium]
MRKHYRHWEKIKDLIDQCIDIMLNHRQSGHPGGSRSKVHAMVMTTLSGAMRWDIRHPEKRFADRFILVAGHTNPMVYATLAVFNEALRARHQKTGDARYLVENAEERALYPEDLLTLRRRGGLPGHAEMEGKTLFFKANTGPTGHGSPVALGQALALKRAGCEEVKVFAFEGEGGHTAGVIHEVKNSAWGLGLSNLVYVLDWNDFGIDDQAISDVVHGTPQTWFESYGWKTAGSMELEDWESMGRAFHEIVWGANPGGVPRAYWYRSRKGRGYGVYDNKSHGAAHKQNNEVYWQTKKDFADKYGVKFEAMGQPAPSSPEEAHRQAAVNIERVMDVLRNDQELLEYLSDRLVEIGDSVPQEIAGFRIKTMADPLKDPVIADYENYPAAIYAKPGTKSPNRAGLSAFGAWLNSYCKEKYDRPLVLACAADLADSTNISGFAKNFEGKANYGWYDRQKNVEGVLLPQEITEFANSGLVCGAAGVNLSDRPYDNWIGFIGACSTYGSFSYLKYGPMRLLSQNAQDSQIKLGKVIWIAGHSGPETAEDSRTHFGIFAPGVTQLFPEGHVINLHPYDHNEVPPMLGAALQTDCAVIALHLTRPAVDIVDREALGVPCYTQAAKGAYVARPFDASKPKQGVVIVIGTSPTMAMMEILRDRKLEAAGLNMKVVFAPSKELFMRQTQAYRDSVLPEDEWQDAMVVSNAARRLVRDWIPNRLCEPYCVTPDHDDMWRTGGSLNEILDESHMTTPWIMKGIERFVADRPERVARLKAALDLMG